MGTGHASDWEIAQEAMKIITSSEFKDEPLRMTVLGKRLSEISTPWKDVLGDRTLSKILTKELEGQVVFNGSGSLLHVSAEPGASNNEGLRFDKTVWAAFAKPVPPGHRRVFNAHDVGAAASRSNRARPSDGRGEEQRDSGRARADRGPRPEGLCVHARRRTRPKKSFERVIASGNHLLTQVKDNQPSLRRRLELGERAASRAGRQDETTGRNRWETRELTVFPAKAWFRDTPWEKLIKTVLRLERTVCKRARRLDFARKRPRSSSGFLGFKPNAAALAPDGLLRFRRSRR